MLYDIMIDGRSFHLELTAVEGYWQCRLNGGDVRVDAALIGKDVLSLLAEGKSHEIRRERTAAGWQLWLDRLGYAVEVRDPRSLGARRNKAGDESGPRKVVASMPGKVVRVLVSENAAVEVGQGIVIVEAMKMQNEIKSPKKGVVQKLIAVVGKNVNAGDVLAIVE